MTVPRVQISAPVGPTVPERDAQVGSAFVAVDDHAERSRHARRSRSEADALGKSRNDQRQYHLREGKPRHEWGRRPNGTHAWSLSAFCSDVSSANRSGLNSHGSTHEAGSRPAR